MVAAFASGDPSQLLMVSTSSHQKFVRDAPAVALLAIPKASAAAFHP